MLAMWLLAWGNESRPYRYSMKFLKTIIALLPVLAPTIVTYSTLEWNTFFTDCGRLTVFIPVLPGRVHRRYAASFLKHPCAPTTAIYICVLRLKCPLPLLLSFYHVCGDM
jgi:hypothetical protein